MGMQRSQAINTFTGGIDQDTSVNKYGNTQYFDAVDMRIVSNDSLSSGALSNINGNKATHSLDMPLAEIIASEEVGDDIVFFAKYPSLSETSLDLSSLVDGSNISLAITSNDGEYIEINIKVVTSVVGDLTGFDTYIKTTDDSGVIFNRIKSIQSISERFHCYQKYILANDIRHLFFSKDISKSYKITRTAGSGYSNISNYNSGSVIYKLDSVDNIDLENITAATKIFDDKNSISKLNFYQIDSLSTVSKIESVNNSKIYFANGIDELRVLNLSKSYSGEVSDLFDVVPMIDQCNISISEISGGSLKSGVYQYACQYYNVNGNESTYMSQSESISISKVSSSDVGGSDIGEVCNKSISVLISNLDTSFDRVKVVSIFYDGSGVESVNEIGDVEVSSNEISVIDSGSNNIPIDINVFRLLKQTSYAPLSIEAKNNYLFQANVKELTFESSTIDDWDSRAYSFSGFGGVSKIYNTPIGDNINDEYYQISSNGLWTRYVNNAASGSGANWSIPSDFNCVNRDNAIYNNDGQIATYAFSPVRNESNLGKYGSDVFGGLGENIEYYFVEYAVSDAVKNNSASTIYTNADAAVDAVFGMPNEIYRVGVEFFNKKGQRSFVKWIGDIRWPHNAYNNLVAMGLVVKIATPPLDDNIAGYRIVKGIANSSDKSIIGFSLTSPTEKSDISTLNRPYAVLSGSDYYTPATTGGISSGLASSGWSVNKKMVELNCPELQYNNGYVSANLNNSKILLSAVQRLYIEDQVLNGDLKIARNGSRSEFTFLDNSDFDTTSLPCHTINDNISIETQRRGRGMLAPRVNIGDQIFQNIISLGSSISTKNSCNIAYLDSDVVMPNVGSGYLTTYHYPIYTIIRDVDSTRYGGYDNNAKSSTEFIPFSKYTPISKSYSTCIFGDTYFKQYEFIRAYYYAYELTAGSGTFTDGMENYIKTHMPSRINSDFVKTDISKYRIYDLNDITPQSATIQESEEIGGYYFPDSYPDDVGNLYTYNTAYSSQLTSTINVIKPSLFIDYGRNITKIISSNRKINNELTDSWGIFLSNNFIELDAGYGEISGIVNHNNKLFCFQENAISVLSINDRSLVNDNSGLLAIGSGGILDRYDYITTYSGAKYGGEIFSTKKTIYYIDRIDNKLYSIGNDSSISETIGVNSLFYNMIKNSNFVKIGYDQEFDEVIFSANNFTIAFNENIGRCISRYSYIPISIVSSKNGMFTQSFDVNSLNYDRNYIFLHNVGDKGAFYNELTDSSAKSTSSITILVNPNGVVVNSFENIELRTDVYNNSLYSFDNSDIIDETISRAVFSNSYIEPFSIESDSYSEFPNISRLIRRWRMKVPLTNNGNRMVDTYMIVKFEYDNNSNKTFRLHDVITTYSNQKGNF